MKPTPTQARASTSARASTCSSGQANTLTLRYEFFRAVTTNGGVGQLSLPTQATNTQSMENTLQVSDSLVLSKNIVDDIRFQYRRFRYQNIAQNDSPTVTVQGSFVDSAATTVEWCATTRISMNCRTTFAAAEGNHSLNFGARLRAYRDANYTTGGTNGQYIFQSLTALSRPDPSDLPGDARQSIHCARDPVRCRAFLPGRLEGKPALYLQLRVALGNAKSYQR